MQVKERASIGSHNAVLSKLIDSFRGVAEEISVHRLGVFSLSRPEVVALVSAIDSDVDAASTPSRRG